MYLQKRKIIKVVLSLALAVAVAFMGGVPFASLTRSAQFGRLARSTPTDAYALNLAGELDCAYICSELDILRGDGNGVTDEYLDKDSTRVQAAYLTLRLVGKETEAENYTGTDNFNDVGHLFAGGQRRTAYLKAHSVQYGWQGDGTNRLMPDEKLTPQQFYKVLLTVLGYEVFVDYDYADTLDFAEDVADMYWCRDITWPLTNYDIAEMLVEAMMATMKGETYTLAEFLAEEGVINYKRAVDLGVIVDKEDTSTPEPPPPPEEPQPSVFRHTDIVTSNFAEIDVVFNQLIDKNTVDRNYIKFDGKLLEDTDFLRVLDDGVTLRIYRPTGFTATQGTTKPLSVSRIKTLSGVVMTAIDSEDVTFIDNQSPTLEGVTAMGLRYVKLLFSEPLKVSDAQVKNYTNYRFNGRTINTTGQIECTGREVYMALSQNLESGQNTLTIDKNRLYDLAGFPIIDVENYPFSAEEDSTPPTVTNIEATREKIVVTFNKEVRDTARLCWVDGSSRRYAQSQEKDPYERNVITFYFSETAYIPVSSIELIIDNIVDMNGVAGAEFRQFVTPTLDTTRPEVAEVFSEKVNEIVVLFTKGVKLGAANEGRFTLKSENNVNISLSVQSYTPEGASVADNRYIKLVGNIPAGNYTLTVVNVEDLTAQANKCAEISLPIMTQDKIPPKVVSVATKINEAKVVITFDKALSWTSASTIANYQYKAPGQGHIDMPSGTNVLLESDAKTIVLQFPIGGWIVSGATVTTNAFTLYIASDSGEQIRLINIEDTAGNKMAPTVIDVPSSNEVAAKLTGDAYAIAPNKIMMKFTNGALPISANSADFVVRSSTGVAIPLRNMSYADIDSTRREITLTIVDGNELNADATYGSSSLPVTVSMVLPGQIQSTKTAFGTPLEMESAAATVLDNIRPGLLEAIRGNRPAQNSGLAAGVQYPALSVNQVLVVFDKSVDFFGIDNLFQLNGLISVTTESAPTIPLSPSSYTIEAFDNHLFEATYNADNIDVRMILLTFNSPTPTEAVSVTVSANLLWNGKYFHDNQRVLNSGFSTQYMPMNP